LASFGEFYQHLRYAFRVLPNLASFIEFYQYYFELARVLQAQIVSHRFLEKFGWNLWRAKTRMHVGLGEACHRQLFIARCMQ